MQTILKPQYEPCQNCQTGGKDHSAPATGPIAKVTYVPKSIAPTMPAKRTLESKLQSHSATLNFRTSQRSTFDHETNPNQNIVTSVTSQLDQAKILPMLYLYILLSLCSGVCDKALRSGKHAFDVYISMCSICMELCSCLSNLMAAQGEVASQVQPPKRLKPKSRHKQNKNTQAGELT